MPGCPRYGVQSASDGWINVSDTGFNMMWHFDWYWSDEPHPRNPRKTVLVWEHPSLATAAHGTEMLDVTNPVTGEPGWDLAEDGTRTAIVSGPFDLAVSLLVLHHVEDTAATLRSILAALAALSLLGCNTAPATQADRDALYADAHAAIAAFEAVQPLSRSLMSR